MDLHQLWTILSTADNVPIVLLLFVVPFYTWYGLRQAFANDRLIAQLEANPEMAKTHHRKTQPWRPEWALEVHVWPYLLRIEFLAAIILTIILMVWSITLNAPHHHPDGVVDYVERAARRAGQPYTDHEPIESAVVLPGIAGDAGVLRPVDGRRGDALVDHHRADGDSLYRHQSAGQRLLHL